MMAQLAWAIILLWCAHLCAPDTPAGQAIRRIMVDVPATVLSCISRGRVIVFCLLAAVLGAASWLQGDAMRMLAMATPEAGAWLATFEVATWLDAVATLGAVISVARLDGVGRALARLVRRPKPRSRRTRSVRTTLKADNDEEDGSAGALAA